MTSANRPILALAFLAVLMLLLASYSMIQLVSAHEQAAQTAQDLASCSDLACQIEILRKRPSLAGTQEIELQDLSARIEQVAAKSQMDAKAIDHITPMAPQRLGESVYLEKPTQIMLRNVTMRQLGVFLQTMTSGEGGLQMKRIRLSAPHEQSDDERWIVDLTLTYLIYSPRPNTVQGAS